MGVKGLWRLLLPIGRRISIETLEGKVLAVDASIWLAQFLSALKDPETGRTAPSAHLVGFFRRLCRLRYHGIRPVFVFDGVPPEAKRRELARRRRRRDDNFAAADGAAIRRLAKRLLVENLGKGRKRRLEKQQQDQKKPSARPGATAASFDPGFNPGDDDDGGINGGGQGGEAEEGAVGTAAVALEEGKNRDEESAPGEEGEDDDGNDWGRQEGAVVAAPDKGEKEEPEADDDVFDDALQLYDGGDDADDDGEFDVDLMANLPPSKRKDAVERAQRRRRMKSRRDFLPAAADPSLFSSVQVSNFLKTCKLNRNIHKAAARAAARDNLKDAMASDRAITVELIREDDDEEEKGVGEYEAAARHGRGVEASAVVAASAAASSPPRKGRLVKRRSGDRRDDNDDDQSEDEMFHEAWHERGIFPDSGGTAKRRSRAIFDDEEEEDDGSENDSHSGGFFPSGGAGGSVRSKQEAADYQLAVVLQQAEREHSSSRLSQGRSHRPASSDVIDLADSEGDGENEGDSEEDDNDHPGGFFPETSGDSSAAAASARPKSPIPAGGAGGSSARAEQEVMDYQLAMALEEADRETGSPRFPQSRVRPGSEQAAASDVIDLADSDTEDDVASVDWEDGQKAPELDRPGSGGAPPAPSQRLVSPSKRSAVERDLSPASTPASAAEIGSNCKRFDGTARSPGWFHSEASTRLSGGVHDVSRVNPPDGIAKDHGVLGPPRGDRRPAKSASASATTGDGDDADDELEWEDGADATDGTDSIVVEHDSKGVKGSDEILFRYNGAHGDWNAHTESPAIDATAAALERGLSTASNLTNWAGVAFRKAIRASGQAGLLSPTNNEKSVPEHLGRSSDEELDIESARFDAKRPQDQQNQTNSLLDDVTTASPPGAVEESVRVDEKFLREWAEEGLERERDMDTITDDMREEVIQLLQLFGVPFIEAPSEAEAQCAVLEELGLVDGIVTEDSDVFVFGGKTIYKNIFEEQKYVEVYKADDAARDMRLGQNEMVALAMLLGGDYTEGVRGVGIVNAMEILETFSMAAGVKTGLTRFRQWLDGIDIPETVVADEDDMSKLREFHEKHRTAQTRWNMPEGFPAENVLQAYLHPVVDKSEERFSWGRPDVDRLVHFCQKFVGWNPEETKRFLDPVMKKLESGFRQTRLDSYMKYEDSIQFAQVRSKRLRQVLRLPCADRHGEDLLLDDSKPSKRQKRTSLARNRRN